MADKSYELKVKLEGIRESIAEFRKATAEARKQAAQARARAAEANADAAVARAQATQTRATRATATAPGRLPHIRMTSGPFRGMTIGQAINAQMRQQARAQALLDRTTHDGFLLKMAMGGGGSGRGGGGGRGPGGQRRAGAGGTSNPWLDLIGTMRFSAGTIGGVAMFPLINRVGQLLGGGAGGTGLAAGVLGAVAAVRTFADVLHGVARQMQAAYRETAIAGGPMGFLMGLGANAGTAASLRQRLASDPWAMMTSLRMGMGITLPRQLDPGMDEAALLQRHIMAIARNPSYRGRLAEARMLGLEGNIPEIELMRRRPVSAAIDAIAAKEMVDATKEWAAVLYAAKRILDAFANLLGAVFMGQAKDLSEVLNGLADIINVTAIAVRKMGEGFRLFLAMINPLFGALHLIAKLFGQDSSRLRALDNHTRAMNNHAFALNNGTFGAGPRARGAMPPKLTGFAFQQAIQGNALRMGAFTL